MQTDPAKDFRNPLRGDEYALAKEIRASTNFYLRDDATPWHRAGGSHAASPRLGLHDGVSLLPKLPGQRGLPQMARQHAMLGSQRSELLSERGYSIRIGR